MVEEPESTTPTPLLPTPTIFPTRPLWAHGTTMRTFCPGAKDFFVFKITSFSLFSVGLYKTYLKSLRLSKAAFSARVEGEMNRDFFIKVVFGTHRVAEFLQEKASIKEVANQLLADLLLFCENTQVTMEHKRNILPRTLREIEALNVYFAKAKNSSPIDPKNFLILEKEYRKISKMLVGFLEQNNVSQEKQEDEAKKKEDIGAPAIPQRQQKILELLKNKEKAQVWEIQRVFPEVTKRTLRRDLDNLLTLNLIERKGEWNNVFYQYKR